MAEEETGTETGEASEEQIPGQISEDEIAQYYGDFAENFTIPETRTAEILYVPNDLILKKYAASDEQVEEYFKTHQKELDTPEKREVLQMVFLDKATAEKALNELNNTQENDILLRNKYDIFGSV